MLSPITVPVVPDVLEFISKFMFGIEKLPAFPTSIPVTELPVPVKTISDVAPNIVLMLPVPDTVIKGRGVKVVLTLPLKVSVSVAAFKFAGGTSKVPAPAFG